ncbi:MAG: dephospho-CoA kinase, partial [Bacteroidaceae bacterium]|nr:dephospho-CoA kinase [Bacteroidaceae bacterium]
MKKETIKLAITGSIGSGKSVVSRMMNVLGVPVYDCDVNAKRLMTDDEFIVSELKRMFGDECYEDDGTLNRQYIASRIFTDKENIKRVNSLVHPVVKRDFEEWAVRQESSVVAVETAILYESGMIEAVDKVLVVWADRETAINRTMQRSGMNRIQVENRMNNQMSVDDLLLMSDYSLYNDGDEPLLPRVMSIVEELKNI